MRSPNPKGRSTRAIKSNFGLKVDFGLKKGVRGNSLDMVRGNLLDIWNDGVVYLESAPERGFRMDRKWNFTGGSFVSNQGVIFAVSFICFIRIFTLRSLYGAEGRS